MNIFRARNLTFMLICLSFSSIAYIPKIQAEQFRIKNTEFECYGQRECDEKFPQYLKKKYQKTTWKHLVSILHNHCNNGSQTACRQLKDIEEHGIRHMARTDMAFEVPIIASIIMEIEIACSAELPEACNITNNFLQEEIVTQKPSTSLINEIRSHKTGSQQLKQQKVGQSEKNSTPKNTSEDEFLKFYLPDGVSLKEFKKYMKDIEASMKKLSKKSESSGITGEMELMKLTLEINELGLYNNPQRIESILSALKELCAKRNLLACSSLAMADQASNMMAGIGQMMNQIEAQQGSPEGVSGAVFMDPTMKATMISTALLTTFTLCKTGKNKDACSIVKAVKKA